MKTILLENDYILEIIDSTHIEPLHSLCSSCSDYFLLCDGQAPSKDTVEEIMKALPPNKTIEDKFLLGVYTSTKELVGVVDLIKDFPSTGEWMLGLMLISPCERSSGLGKLVHNGIMKLGQSENMKSMRIGVVQCNRRALKFWEGLGYSKIKEVTMDFSEKTQLVSVMKLHLENL